VPVAFQVPFQDSICFFSTAAERLRMQTDLVFFFALLIPLLVRLLRFPPPVLLQVSSETRSHIKAPLPPLLDFGITFFGD